MVTQIFDLGQLRRAIALVVSFMIFNSAFYCISQITHIYHIDMKPCMALLTITAIYSSRCCHQVSANDKPSKTYLTDAAWWKNGIGRITLAYAPIC